MPPTLFQSFLSLSGPLRSRRAVVLLVACLIFAQVRVFKEAGKAARTTETPGGADAPLFEAAKAGGTTETPGAADKLLQVHRNLDIMPHSYITMWLHQFHRWFGDESQRLQGVQQFVLEAREAGFGAVMVDISWEWTEREQAGQYDIHSFQKDWVQQVCDAGLKLHVVLAMRHLPPWVNPDDRSKFVEVTSRNCSEKALSIPIVQPSVAHPIVWDMMQAFVGNTTLLLTQSYGDCLASISPTFNNEFETRFSQTHAIMRDYSTSAVALYQEWQRQQKHSEMANIREEPPQIPCSVLCQAIKGEAELEWMAFREDFLASRYIQMCRLAKKVAADAGSRSKPLNCLLHMGEMLATTDHLNSNLFFQLATSDAVDEVVMDSNMMLLGAPTSPSVVGLMVSLAMVYSQKYNKVVHYELATERVLPCNDNGQIISTPDVENRDRGANLLIRTGVESALQAGVQSLGVTNLCKPNQANLILPLEREGASLLLRTAGSSTSTAVIFVPYHIFYAYSFGVAGITCNLNPVPCWHESFSQMEFFGWASHIPDLQKRAGMCPTDAAQATVLEAWEDLRHRHEHVAVVGDVHQLRDLAATAKERVMIRFPCIMEEDAWHIWRGQEIRETYLAIHGQYPFTEKHHNQLC